MDVGPATLLSRDLLQAVKESVTDAYSPQQLNWQFIPPGSTHMGACGKLLSRASRLYFWNQQLRESILL